jgi:hypothetical protein
MFEIGTYDFFIVVRCGRLAILIYVRLAFLKLQTIK